MRLDDPAVRGFVRDVLVVFLFLTGVLLFLAATVAAVVMLFA